MSAAATSSPFTAEQLDIRRTKLTASDIPAVLGLSPYRTPADVWRAKVLGEEEYRGNWRTRRGHAVEPIILDAVAEQTGLRVVRRSAETIYHPIFSWLGATPDADVFDGDHLVGTCEVKDVGLRMAKHWYDFEGALSVPDYVLVQAQVQATLRRVPRIYVGVWLATDDEPRHVQLDSDEELWLGILEGCQRFWTDHVLTGQPPPPMSAEDAARTAKSLFPRHTPAKWEPSTPEHEIVATELLEAKRMKTEAESRLKSATARMQSLMGDCEGVSGRGWKATWKYQDGYEVKAHHVDGYRKFLISEVKAK